MAKRIAILGFSLETNRFAAPCGESHFRDRALLYGGDITTDARSDAPRGHMGIAGFYKTMDDLGDWQPVPIVFANAVPNGPAEQGFFEHLLTTMDTGLRAAAPLDGVYICEHGAGLAVGHEDPDGEIFQLARDAVGPDVPVIATLDLHANVSEPMISAPDMVISYITNPHIDQWERGVEAAEAMAEMFAGTRPKMAAVRLPLVAPSVTLLTAEGHPYGDLIRQGQERLGDDIMNVSINAGFAFSDTERNGMTVVVTARRDQAKADAVARELAVAAWADRHRYQTRMTSLEDAVALARSVAADPAKPNVLYCDPADNPGGGGRGNTTYILKAFLKADVRGAVFGIFNDPALVEAATSAGAGNSFRAKFNTAEENAFSEPLETDARVEKLSDGTFTARYGSARGTTIRLGPACLLDLGGILVVVISHRQQCLSNDYFTHFGVDAADARCTVVKSRGHFRAGFNHLFPPERIYEIDVPGLTSPNLGNFQWQHMPRPVYPMDPETEWRPQTAG